MLVKEKNCFKIVPENHGYKKKEDKALDNAIVFPDQATSWLFLKEQTNAIRLSHWSLGPLKCSADPNWSQKLTSRRFERNEQIVVKFFRCMLFVKICYFKCSLYFGFCIKVIKLVIKIKIHECWCADSKLWIIS